MKKTLYIYLYKLIQLLGVKRKSRLNIPDISEAKQIDSKLIYSEEFDGNMSDWSYSFDWFGEGDLNTEYRKGEVRIKDGLCRILSWTFNKVNYSGMITTYKSRFFNNGYFEVKCKIPSGEKGIFPAFWLMSENCKQEIDVFEVWGDNPNKVKLGTHYWNKDSHEHDAKDFIGVNFTDKWFLFGVEKTDTEISWYINRKKVRTIPNLHFFDKQCLVFNVFLTESIKRHEPIYTYIDYIRVYKSI